LRKTRIHYSTDVVFVQYYTGISKNEYAKSPDLQFLRPENWTKGENDDRIRQELGFLRIEKAAGL